MEDDEWVENTQMEQKNVMPVERRNDPATIIEINARLFKVDALYIEEIVSNMLQDSNILKSH
jgi:hypothetical protein